MPGARAWKSRPVFITSTFQDMQDERDYLRRFVFPSLEEWLRTKRRHLEWIDLRVGVATAGAGEEEARELQVLKVCLEEVKRSRPFLIGLIGDRYGWVPPRERMAAAAAEAGISGDVADRSVTDLEIDLGVFQDTEQQHRSLLFFRERLPYDKMPPKKAAEYSDAYATDAGAARRVRQLEKLKERIKSELPGRHFDYHAEWDAQAEKVTELEAWGKDVEAKVRQAIEEDLADEPPTSSEQTEDDVERDALADFSEDRARDFIGRSKLLAEIEALLASRAGEGASWGICVTGEAGSGKSALFATLHQGLTGVEKDANTRRSDEQRALHVRLRCIDALVLAHAAGASPRAPSVGDMLRRWIGELASFLGVDHGLPDNAGADEVDAAFASLLGRAAMQRRVIVLVDALDQFEPTPRGRFVTWLPRLWPENARLIAIGIPGDASEALAQRPDMALLPIPPLDASEARDIAIAITARYHRQLEPEVLDALIAGPDAPDVRWRNPLWLVLAVEELNLLDADDFARAQDLPFGRDDERLRALMCGMSADFPADIAELYRQTFDRAAELFGGKLAGAFLGMIAVSRSGWRESDFRAVLPGLSGEDWDELRFAQLRRLFRGQLRQRSAMGQWDVMHAQMRKAIRAWLAERKVAEAELHASLARHLLASPIDDLLRVTETMRHLFGAQQLAEAANYYTDPELPMNAKASATQFLADAWLANEIDPPVRVNLGAMLTLPELSDDITGLLAHQLLFDLRDAVAGAGILQPLSDLLELLHPVFERLNRADSGRALWVHDLSNSHIEIGDVQRSKGKLEAALTSYQASLRLSNRLAKAAPGIASAQRILSLSHERIGLVHLAQRDLPTALKSFQITTTIMEQLTLSNPDDSSWQIGHSVSLKNLGDVQTELGNLPAALASYRAAFEISDRLAKADTKNSLRLRELSVSLGRIGNIQSDQGDLSAALERFPIILDRSRMS